MRIIGIDPGLTGGIAALTEGMGPRLFAIPSVKVDKGRVLNLPLTVEIIRSLCPSTRGVKVYLEKVHAMPGQGVSSMFKFGHVSGAIEGILTALSLPYELVTPQRWMREMHAGFGEKDPKIRSLLCCHRLFPDVKLFEGRERKAHPGKVDALCIAEYGRRQMRNVERI